MPKCRLLRAVPRTGPLESLEIFQFDGFEGVISGGGEVDSKEEIVKESSSEKGDGHTSVRPFRPAERMP